MTKFATYLHPHTCYTSKPSSKLSFVGHSLPHYSKIRQELEKALVDYPTLPVRRVDYAEYLSVHTDKYLIQLALMALEKPLPQKPKLSTECTNLQYCLPGYLYGLGGMIEAIDHMKKGILERAYCFSLVGHHAHEDWGHGYCLLNPLAAAARYAQTQDFHKILIVDWDIHHGDGTQSIFSHDPSVYCISIHSVVDLYMAKASNLKAGTTTKGEEVGHCNIPILSQIYEDDLFEKIHLTGDFYRGNESRYRFQLALERIPWNPDLILIFSGYDSHKDDCGQGITDWTNQDFKLLTEYVLDLAKKVSCPVLSSHGGGYKLPVTVSAAVSHVAVLASY
ncbi:histone deacetylase family protein [Argonema galeatum]|uniref:histone deacetylase family protein n=1 Tax=Argonema galeatum TaxID=2942762 RepID=UPI0020131B8C|nr:histone deacetylase [Argonema galeatum]MCL1465652.1 histone deacetylase [Argonema galeatum A003/A1]